MHPEGWQHPLGQEWLLHSHVPLTQFSPKPQAGSWPHPHVPSGRHTSAVCGLHLAHNPPGNPHVVTLRAVHIPSAQHPLGQDVASQMQAPSSHRCPVTQGGPAPHWQSPVAEQ